MFGFRTCRVVPEIQSESADCGVVCISMVCNFLGICTDAFEVKRRYGSSGRGLTLLQIRRILADLEFHTQIVQFDPCRPEALAIPSILQWNRNHFVVLESVDARRGRITLLDPEFGRVRVSNEEFQESATGLALECLSAPSGNPPLPLPSQYTVRPLFHGVRVKRGALYLLLVSVGIHVAELVLPLLSRQVFDRVMPAEDLDLLVVVALGVLALSGFNVLLGSMRNIGVVRMGAEVSALASANLFGTVLRMPLNRFARRSNAQLMARFSSMERLVEFLTNAGIGVTTDLFLVVLALGVTAHYSPILAMVALVFSTVQFIVRSRLHHEQYARFAVTVRSATMHHTKVMGLLRAIEPIKLYCGEQSVLEQYRLHNGKVQKARLDHARAQERGAMIGGALQSLDSALFILLGAFLLMRGGITIGEYLAISMYRALMSSKLSQLLDILFEYRRLGVHRRHIGELIRESILDDTPDPEERRPVTGRLEIRGVSFSYSPLEPNVLEKVFLDIKAGSSVAIVAPSGSGKSTLCRLLLGLLQPTQGEILLDGKPLHDGRNPGLKHIGCVLQDDHLIDASIEENITFFREGLSREDVVWAARMANIHDEIMQLPMQYDTPVSDDHVALSGGQRQRILIARALCGRPVILIMDEATSNLDLDNERVISENISKLRMTRIVFSHRPETISTCERVVDLAAIQGKAAEGGSLFDRRQARAGGRRNGPRCPGSHVNSGEGNAGRGVSTPLSRLR